MGLLSMFSASVTALPWRPCLALAALLPCCPMPTSLAGVRFPQPWSSSRPQFGTARAHMCCARCWRRAVHSGNFGSQLAKSAVSVRLRSVTFSPTHDGRSDRYRHGVV